MDKLNDPQTLRRALEKLDKVSVKGYVDRLQLEAQSPKNPSREYAKKLKTRLQIARDVLGKLSKRRTQAAPTPRGIDPPISSDDKYDPRGRAPPVREPRDPTPGVVKVAHQRRTDRR